MLKIDKYMSHMRRRQNYPQKNDFKVKHVPSPIKVFCCFRLLIARQDVEKGSRLVDGTILTTGTLPQIRALEKKMEFERSELKRERLSAAAAGKLDD